MFLLANIIIIVTYLAGILLDRFFDVPLLMQISGMAWLILLTPYNFMKIFGLKERSNIVRYLIFLTLFFFFYAPLYAIAHQVWGLPANHQTILIINIAIFIAAYVATLIRKESISTIVFPRFRATHWLLIFGLATFAITHIINFQFYEFIPEIDGYGEIRVIDRNLEQERIGGGRKPALYATGVILSTFTGIEPYSLFSFWLIAFQSTLLIVIYLFIQMFRIRSKALKVLLMLAAISVPVINMEVDIVRAQTGYVLGFPIFIYFLSQAIHTRRFAHWMYAGLIAIFGMLYHEFSVSLALLFFATLFTVLFRRYFLRAEDKKDRSIFLLSIGLAVSLIYSFAQEFRALRFTNLFIERQFSNITQFSEWRWWFLHSYATDIEEMGWSGLWGAAQYYGYSASPPIIMIFLLLIGISLVLRRKIFSEPLFALLIPLIFIFLFFAEGLPRMNAPYLPERMWLLITLALVLAAVPIWKYVEQYWQKYIKQLMALFLLTILVGMGGSFYVAFAKETRINNDEHQASLWIDENTPHNAFFITQRHNTLVVNHFGNRQAITPVTRFFLSDDVVSVDETTLKDEEDIDIETIQIKQNELQSIIDTMYQISSDIIDLDSVIASIQQEVDRIDRIITSLKVDHVHDAPLYVLYSEHKCDDGLYAQREWWREANFCDANLEKFNETYPVVYSEDGVHIWKIK